MCALTIAAAAANPELQKAAMAAAKSFLNPYSRPV
jgi:hypothetical protein